MLDKIWNRKMTSLPMLLVELFIIFSLRLGNFFITTLWRKNLGKVGKDTKIQLGTTIRYPKNISLDDNVTLARNVEIFTEFKDSACVIGPFSQINKNVHLDYSGGLTIGSNVVISEGSSIYTHDHRGDPKSVPIKTPLFIEDDVWIGGHVIILEGAGRIGKGAMVGAGSIVKKAVRPDTVVAGNPAREIAKRNFAKK